MAETTTNPYFVAKHLADHAATILDEENYRGDRNADAQAMATIALAYAVLSVSEEIGQASAEAGAR